MGELKSVELDVCVTVSEAFDHALDGFLRPIVVAGDFVADGDDGTPILGGKVLVSRLGCEVEVLEDLSCEGIVTRLMLTDDLIVRAICGRAKHGRLVDERQAIWRSRLWCMMEAVCWRLAPIAINSTF